jgi:hypothetical protein
MLHILELLRLPEPGIVLRRGVSDALGEGGGRKESEPHLINEQLGAMEADRAQNLEHRSEEPDVEHRLGQFEVPEVTGTLCHRTRAGGTLHLPIYGSHPGIEEALHLGLPLFVGFMEFDLCH